MTSAYFPLSAVAVASHIFETFLVPGNAMNQLITMAAHPVGCDIALKVIEIMERDGLVDRVRHNAERHLSKLSTLGRLPGVRDVRGLGHMWGLELAGADGDDGSTLARDVAGRCFDAGLLVLQAGNMIRINPPLVASDAEMAFIVETLIAAVTAAAGAGDSGEAPSWTRLPAHRGSSTCTPRLLPRDGSDKNPPLFSCIRSPVDVAQSFQDQQEVMS